jgi:APA family basic amino acid/polyamine antiporter
VPPADEPAAAPAPEREEGGLKRVLGLFDVTMIVMGCIIGAGVFRTPAAIARLTPSIGGILGVWALGGVIALTGAFVFGELAAMFPRSGGEYVFVKEPFGRFPAFMFGWLLLAAIVSNATAFVAVVFADHLDLLVRHFGGSGFGALGRPFVGFLQSLTFGADPATITPDAAGAKVVAALLIILFTIVNIRGVRLSATVQNVAMVAKIAGILTVIALGVVAMTRGQAFAATPAAAAPAPAPAGEAHPFLDFTRAMFLVMFTYGGWQNVAAVGSEVKRPQRTLPVGMLLGTVAVVALYMLLNFALVAILGVHDLAASATPTADAAGRVVAGGEILVAALVMTSTFAITQALLFVTPRIYYAMAQDGLFFRGVGRVHPRFGTPWVAIALQGAFILVHLVLGSVLDLLNLATLFDWLGFTLCGLGLFVLRFKRPDAPRPYRATGYPYLPAVFLALALYVFLFHLPLAEPAALVRGAVVFVVGLLLFLFFRRQGAPEGTEERGDGRPS